MSDDPTDPVTPAEWQEAATTALVALALHNAAELGLASGLPHIDLERARTLLARAMLRGYLPDLAGARRCLRSYGIATRITGEVTLEPPPWARQYVAVRSIEGRLYAVDALTLGRAAIVGPCDEYGWEHQWTYASQREAMGELMAWDGSGEPQGWTRHMPSGRH